MSTLMVTCLICGKIIAEAQAASFSQDMVDAYSACSCETDGTADVQITVDDSVVYTTPPIVQTPVENEEDALTADQEFGQSLIIQFSAENAIAGFTPSQLAGTLEECSGVMAALSIGALNIAIILINALTPDGVVITTTRIAEYRNAIQAYLGIPLT
jgi:hypothetical protein